MRNTSETEGLGALRGSSVGLVHYALLRLQAAVNDARFELERPEILLEDIVIHPMFDDEWHCIATMSMSGEAYSSLIALEGNDGRQ